MMSVDRQEVDAAERDALIYGNGVLLDGRRIDPSRISLVAKPSAAALALRRINGSGVVSIVPGPLVGSWRLQNVGGEVEGAVLTFDEALAEAERRWLLDGSGDVA